MSLCNSFFSLLRCSLSLARLWLLERRNAKWTLGLGSPSWLSRERRRFLLSESSSSVLEPSVSGIKLYRFKKKKSPDTNKTYKYLCSAAVDIYMNF